MTRDAAVMVLIGCLFGFAYMAMRRYTDWTRYDWGVLELSKLLTATGTIRAKWTVVWVIEGGCWASAAYVITRFIDSH